MNIAGVCLLVAANAAGAMEAEFYQDLQGKDVDAKVNWFGPDHEKVRKKETHGLRITLPANREKKEAVGLSPSFGIAGDFEITLAYELIKAEQPTTGYGVGVNIWLTLDSPETQTAKVGHYLRIKEGNTFFADYKLGDSKPKYRMKTRPTSSMAGKLRLARTGAVLRCMIAEPDSREFEELLQVAIGSHHVRRVRFAANTGGSPAMLDARFIDIRIRGDDLGEAPLLEKPAPIGVVYFGAAVVVALMLAAAVWRWKSNRTPQLPIAAVGKD